MALVLQNLDEYNNLVKTSEKPIVLWFTASWCGPCKKIAPFFYETAKKIDECYFYVIDIDNLDEIAEAYNITSIPTFVFLKNKEIFDILKGGNEQDFLSILSNIFKEELNDTNNKKDNEDNVEQLEIDALPDAFNSDINNYSFL